MGWKKTSRARYEGFIMHLVKPVHMAELRSALACMTGLNKKPDQQ
jgi:hypothetical protein